MAAKWTGDLFTEVIIIIYLLFIYLFHVLL